MDQFLNRVKDFVPTSVSCEKNLAENVKEYEEAVRKATVYLFTRPLDGRSDEDDSFRHWALVFYFKEDSTIRYVEGNEHEDQLKAFYFKESPRETGKYYELGEITTSPKMLREIAVKNALNYTGYCVGINNCQNWVKQFAKDLGDDGILLKLKDYSSLAEAHPFFAYVASSSGRSWKSTSKWS